MAGAEPVLLPATAATGFLPDLDAIPAETLARTAAFYLCTPANPAEGDWEYFVTVNPDNSEIIFGYPSVDGRAQFYAPPRGYAVYAIR